MVRKQIYIAQHQERRLKRQARESGVTEAAIVRRGLDMALEQAGEALRDADAWKEKLAFIKQRAKLPPLGRKRTWKREGLYESRLPPRH